MAARELNRGLKWLFPDGQPNVDWYLIDDGDGLGPKIAFWNRLEPQPTEEQIDAAIAASIAAEQQATEEAATLKQAIVTLAQSAVGVALNDLTAAQRNALIAILLWRAGAIDKTLKVRPLAQWVNGS